MEHDISLGISLGSRFLGLAIMHNQELIDWQVRSFSDAMSEQKIHMICGAILRIVTSYGITLIVLKEPLALDIHDNLLALKRHLLKLLNDRDIPVHCLSLAQIKERLQPGITNKQQLATCVTSLYPQLRFIYLKEQQIKNPYYLKIFEAVAALHVYHARTT